MLFHSSNICKDRFCSCFCQITLRNGVESRFDLLSFFEQLLEHDSGVVQQQSEPNQLQQCLEGLSFMRHIDNLEKKKSVIEIERLSLRTKKYPMIGTKSRHHKNVSVPKKNKIEARRRKYWRGTRTEMIKSFDWLFSSTSTTFLLAYRVKRNTGKCIKKPKTANGRSKML